MDLNGDGRKDFLTGSYSGVPQWIENTADGFGEPASIVDKNGDSVLLGTFWNFETEEWDETDRANSKGHGTSAAAVDWDNDGDFDLLLGDYRGGTLFLRINEGDAKEPKFAATNEPVKVGNVAVEIEGGLANPCVVDWNEDGLFDIIFGGITGGVFILENTGSKNSPKFDELSTLVEPLPGPSNSKAAKRVSAINGQPTAPGSSFHVEAVDYDHDGDLDLLVGARCSWLTGPLRKMTAEDEEQLVIAKSEALAAYGKLQDFKKTAETKEALKELTSGQEYRDLLAEYRRLASERSKLTSDPVEYGDYIWLFRRK